MLGWSLCIWNFSSNGQWIPLGLSLSYHLVFLSSMTLDKQTLYRIMLFRQMQTWLVLGCQFRSTCFARLILAWNSQTSRYKTRTSSEYHAHTYSFRWVPRLHLYHHRSKAFYSSLTLFFRLLLKTLLDSCHSSPSSIEFCFDLWLQLLSWQGNSLQIRRYLFQIPSIVCSWILF